MPRVPVAPHVVAHAVRLARATRPGEDGARIDSVRSYVGFGAGPRASQGLILGAKARAVLEGRFAAEVEDVRALAHPVLVHRLVTNFRAEADRVSARSIVDDVLRAVGA